MVAEALWSKEIYNYQGNLLRVIFNPIQTYTHKGEEINISCNLYHLKTRNFFKIKSRHIVLYIAVVCKELDR